MNQRERLLTLPFALAFGANFLHGMALHPYLHIGRFVEQLGADPSLVGLVFGTMSGAAIAIRPFAGWVMDRTGRRVVILVGGVLHVVACALYLSVDSLGGWLLFVRALQGFAEGAIFSSLFTYVADIVPASRRTEGLGLFGVSGMLPMALGGLLGDVVLAHGSYRDLFLATVGIATAALFASLPMKETTKQIHTVAGRGFLDALWQRDLLPIWFVGSAFATALAGVFAFLKSFVEAEQIGSVGLFFSFYAGAAILLRVLFGWVPDRYGPKRVFYPAMAVIAAAMAVLAGAQSPSYIAAAGILAGLGHGYAFPILSAIVVTRANPADRGSAMSLFTAIFDAGILIGSPLLGWIAETGADGADYRRMYWVAAAIPAVGAVIFYFWDRLAVARMADGSAAA